MAIGDLDAAEAEAAAAALPGEAAGFELDVTDEASFARFLDATEERLGPLDVLVNNAGIMFVGPLEDAGYRGASKVIDVNVKGVVIGMHLAIPRLRASGAGGHIVNVVSSSAWIAPPALAVYSASKHAARGLTDAVRAELRPAGIHVTAVYPGVVQTDLAVGTKASRGREDDRAARGGRGDRRRDRAPARRGVRAALARPGAAPVYQAVPPRARRALGRAIGLDALYSSVDPASRREYEERSAFSFPSSAAR